MIKTDETFPCNEQDCGRKFPSLEDLQKHKDRRHQSTLTKTLNKFDELNLKIKEIEKETIDLLPSSNKSITTTSEYIDSMSINDQYISTITEEMIGANYYSVLEDIDEVNKILN